MPEPGRADRQGRGPSGTDTVPGRSGPDWLRNILTVSRPAAEVTRFRAAARGTGAVPWALDLAAEEAAPHRRPCGA